MKKIFLLTIAIIVLCGCAGFGITMSDPNIVEKGKQIGVLVAAFYPEITAQALPYAQGLLKAAKGGELSADQFYAAVNALTAKCTNRDVRFAIAAATILLPAPEIKMGETNGKAVDILEGFIEGLESLK